jgi:phosphoribosylaminoimidazolecarboxamide formyltransferase/IMP cyclohydrolase
MSEIVAIRRALLSVYNKTGLIELARALASARVELLASGGTRAALLGAGIPVTEIAEYTGQPEILGGRVKTLHPKIHAGILARRDVPADLAALEQQAFQTIDLVVVNLYPFEATIERPDATLEDAIENIDVGGPTLIRAAAKNHANVAVLTRPEQYPDLIASIRDHGGTTGEFRRRHAALAFMNTALYDAHIYTYLAHPTSLPRPTAVHSADANKTDQVAFPMDLGLHFLFHYSLRYGENPHQHAAFYHELEPSGPGLATAKMLHGKELSYNNLLDLDSALRLVRSFAEPAACIIKHNNPCGAAVGADLSTAFEQAYDGDPLSAFGGIVAVNRVVDRPTAERMCQPGRFIEAILAPGFADDALEELKTKPTWRNSVRLLDLGAPIAPGGPGPAGFDLRRIEGGLLVQSWDSVEPDPAAGSAVTSRAPGDAERRDLEFAWRVCAHVRSNAIVLAKNSQVVGVGAGQMSRLDSVRIAVEKAGPRAPGSVLASDAFFPFRDGPDLAAAHGVTAIIQPGGSRRDDQTIEACNEHGIAMLLTGRRHFRH